MKLNWGYGILFTLILFASMILFMAYKASKIDLDLVANNYYAQEVAYQSKLDKINRTAALSEKPTIDWQNNSAKIQFPNLFKGKHLTGQVHLFRPSSANLDVIIPLSLDSTLTQVVPKSNLHTGMYAVKIDWTVDGLESYFQETNLFVP